MVWRSRSDLPVSAACAIANAMQDALAQMTRSPLRLRLLEPLVPEPEAWPALLNGARVHAVRGTLASAAFVLRERDAAALARLVLGESARGPLELSKIETAVVERIFAAMAPALSAVCGANLRQAPAPDTFLTYFDLTAGPDLRIGVALSQRQQTGAPPRTLTLSDLGAVTLDLRVELAAGVLTASEVLGLRPGLVVPMMTKVGEPGVVRLAGAALARGQCGANGARFALVIQE